MADLVQELQLLNQQAAELLQKYQEIKEKIESINIDTSNLNADKVDGADASISPLKNTLIVRENDNGEFQIKDRATGIVYRIFIENGALKLEVV